jgi:DNA invertase Pin-like site-specific DNA recombinase
VGFRSFTEPYFDSCEVFKDAVIATIATLAKQERVKRAERTKAGLAIARAKGKTLGRPGTLRATSSDVVRLRTLGKSFRCVARELGISLRSVQRLAVSE